MLQNEHYAEIIHSRLNHLQVLLSSLCGAVLTFCTAITAVVLTKPVNLESSDHIRIVAFTLYIGLTWANLFSLYQGFAVLKCARVLASLEQTLNNYRGPHYFRGGPTRYWLHMISHGLPTYAALGYPFIFYKHHQTLALIGFAVVAAVTIIFCILLNTSILGCPQLPNSEDHRPNSPNREIPAKESTVREAGSGPTTAQ